MNEKVLLKAVIVFPMRRKQVLLARKTRHIGAGCLNGYGGGIEDGETAVEAAVRELRIESKLDAQADNLEKVGEINFHNQTTGGSFFTCRCEVFLLRKWTGKPASTPEMEDPQWFSTSNLPLTQMMPADATWVPLVLNGWKIIGNAWYGPHQKILLQPTRVRYVQSFS